MKILALGAHPDDIEIFMFGTLAAYAALGAELAFAIATDGAKGGKGDPAALARARREEALAAAGLLGVTPYFLDFPDGALVADDALIGALKALIGEVQPDLAITHAPNDYHGDHRALSDALRIAASFAVPVLHADTLGGTGFSPTHYVDIAAHWDIKAKAIRAHRSQDPERFVAGARARRTNSGPGNATAHPARWPRPSASSLSSPSPTYANCCLRRRRSGR